MTKTAKTLMALSFLFSLAACENDDPISNSQVLNANITCIYTISPEMLRYFDYTLRYTDDEGYTAYTTIDRSVAELNLYSSAMPSERLFKFTVTRNDMPAPTEPVEWQQTFDVEVVRNYIDGHTDTITASNTTTYSPTPENFEQWATQQYIPLMEQGYEIYINYAGTVNFSFD